jgi:hypothetical protein
VSQCKCVQYSTVKELSSARFKFTSVLAWLWLNSDHSRSATPQRSPAWASPAPCTAKMGDGNDGARLGGSVVDQAHRDVKRWSGGLLDAVLVSRRRQG